MRNKITMEMSICQAENGFSLDELVKKSGRFLRKEGFCRHFEDELTTDSRGFDVPNFQWQEQYAMLSEWTFNAE